MDLQRAPESSVDKPQQPAPEKKSMVAFFQQAQMQRREAVQPVVDALDEEWMRTEHERN